jgi:hypothetical protein
MNKLVSVVALSVISTAGLTASVATAGSAAASATGIYANCTALHTRWAHGVGKRYAHDHTSGVPVRNFYHSTYWYNVAMRHNSGLDRDKDGIACEAR